jgi:hypothetical protein
MGILSIQSTSLPTWPAPVPKKLSHVDQQKSPARQVRTRTDEREKIFGTRRRGREKTYNAIIFVLFGWSFNVLVVGSSFEVAWIPFV